MRAIDLAAWEAGPKSELEIRNFRSFRQAKLPLSPLTVLVGANASGKSNALEALQLLSWMAAGRRLYEFPAALRDREVRIRGGVPDLPRRGSALKSFGFSLFGFHLREDFEIELAADAQGLRVVDEALGRGTGRVPLYEVRQPATPEGSELKVAYNNFARGGQKPVIACVDTQPVFTQLLTPARFSSSRAQNEIPTACRELEKLLTEILFLDPDPSRMRGYSSKLETRLAHDGANLSTVLWKLQEQGMEERVRAFVRSLPEQQIEGIALLPTPREEVMLQLVETFGGRRRKVEAPLLSDGTLRVLAIAAAILSAPKGSIVVIEEIDNGVHPSRVHQLLREIQRAVRERKLVALVSTHNPALLDALPEDALEDVVACYRDPEKGDSRLIRLGDLERFPALVAQGSLGDLVTQGVLDRFLKTRESAEERRKKNEAWLAELEASRV